MPIGEGERALHRGCAWRRRHVLCDEASAHLRLLLRLTSEERDRLGVLSQPHERIAQIRLAQKLCGRLADKRLPRRKGDPSETTDTVTREPCVRAGEAV